MPNNDETTLAPNVCSSSTMLLGDEPKMRAHPQGIGTASAAVRSRRRRKQRRALTAPVQVVMTIRLGAEPQVILRGSGITWRYPADRALYDVVRHFNWLIDNQS